MARPHRRRRCNVGTSQCLLSLLLLAAHFKVQFHSMALLCCAPEPAEKLRLWGILSTLPTT